VSREVRGREHWLTLEVKALSPAEAWIEEQVEFWSRRTDALEARLRGRRAGGGAGE
jgi:hypothetical protein